MKRKLEIYQKNADGKWNLTNVIEDAAAADRAVASAVISGTKFKTYATARDDGFYHAADWIVNGGVMYTYLVEID